MDQIFHSVAKNFGHGIGVYCIFIEEKGDFW